MYDELRKELERKARANADASYAAFYIALIALALVTAFAVIMLLPERFHG